MKVRVKIDEKELIDSLLSYFTIPEILTKFRINGNLHRFAVYYDKSLADDIDMMFAEFINEYQKKVNSQH